jgi:hypothetical protein
MTSSFSFTSQGACFSLPLHYLLSSGRPHTWVTSLFFTNQVLHLLLIKGSQKIHRHFQGIMSPRSSPGGRTWYARLVTPRRSWYTWCCYSSEHAPLALSPSSECKSLELKEREMQYSLCRAVMSAFASPVFHDCIRACLLALLFVIVPSVLGSTAQALLGPS